MLAPTTEYVIVCPGSTVVPEAGSDVFESSNPGSRRRSPASRSRFSWLPASSSTAPVVPVLGSAAEETAGAPAFCAVKSQPFGMPEKRTRYSPYARSVKRYCPESSVVVVRGVPSAPRTGEPSASSSSAVTPATPGSPRSCRPFSFSSTQTRSPSRASCGRRTERSE
ncbi:hypothetical protein Agsp01_25530 [Agromyces sp. NBRC 114283]|nr:hypothetical protein Agsp01_25530 [Agromyces sp. NBRC 114283]